MTIYAICLLSIFGIGLQFMPGAQILVLEEGSGNPIPYVLINVSYRWQARLAGIGVFDASSTYELTGKTERKKLTGKDGICRIWPRIRVISWWWKGHEWEAHYVDAIHPLYVQISEQVIQEQKSWFQVWHPLTIHIWMRGLPEHCRRWMDLKSINYCRTQEFSPEYDPFSFFSYVRRNYYWKGSLQSSRRRGVFSDVDAVNRTWQESFRILGLNLKDFMHGGTVGQMVTGVDK